METILLSRTIFFSSKERVIYKSAENLFRRLANLLKINFQGKLLISPQFVWPTIGLITVSVQKCRAHLIIITGLSTCWYKVDWKRQKHHQLFLPRSCTVQMVSQLNSSMNFFFLILHTYITMIFMTYLHLGRGLV